MIKVALQNSFRAMKSNLLPGVVLQLLSLSIIISYYNIPAIKSFFEKVSVIKSNGGVWLAMLSTAIFGGVIPLLIQQLSKKHRQPKFLMLLTFFFFYWAYKGLEVDRFYFFQAKLFGDNNEFTTVLYKVLFDEFIYTPILGATTIILAFAWKENNFKFKGYFAILDQDWYSRKVLPLVVSNWIIWIPTVSIIYSLPLTLQLPVQNLILCFWSLIIIFLTSEEN